jgi:tetratricopeptide (TPR) repeat protein
MHQKAFIHPCFMSFLALVAMILLSAMTAPAQETGGDLGGGAGIFRPKNPATKPKSARPVARANIETQFEQALDNGNDARDAHKYSEAERSYQAALKLKPRDERATYGLGNVFADQQRWVEAEKAYRQAVLTAPSNADALIALSFVLVQPTAGADNARRFADAEGFARRAVQLQPTNAVAFDRLGVALQARGIFNKDTESAFRRAMELDPDFVVAQVHLARTLRKMNRGSEADPFYQAAVAQAKDVPTLVLIADAMQSEQRWDDSEPLLRRALDKDARNPVALALLGRFLVATKAYADAEPILKRAIEVSPKSFQLHNLLGRAYLGLQRYDDAFKTYERGVGLASAADRKQLAGAFGFTGVGDGLMDAARPKDAVRAYDQALQLDPDNSDLQAKAAAARAKAAP